MKITENEVHIWVIRLDLDYDHKNYQKHLNEIEKQTADNMQAQKIKKNHVVCHFATHEILSRYLNIALDSIPFTYSKFFKPFLLQNEKQVEFNLTHSSSIALLGVTKKFRIGIDIEKIKPIDNREDVEKLVFTNKERLWIAQQQIDQDEKFYRLWTAKESLIKGIGEGFYFGPEKLDCHMSNDLTDRVDLRITPFPEESPQWTIHNFIPEITYMGAFATKQPVKSFSQFVWMPTTN